MPDHTERPSPQLTKARQRALEVLAVNGRARESNVTALNVQRVGGMTAAIYWQTCAWLVDAGLARRTGENFNADVEITPLGRHQLHLALTWRGFQLPELNGPTLATTAHAVRTHGCEHCAAVS